MDLTNKYIKMCESCEELQEVLAPIFATGRSTFIGDIWLPMQDEIQTILHERFEYQLGGMIDIFCKWITVFTFPCGTHDSMEQIWLALLMDREYYQKWTGEKWIRIPLSEWIPLN